MAGSKTDDFENELLSWVTGQAAGPFGNTNTPYCGLLTIVTDGETETVTEVSSTTDDANYARIDTSGLWGAPSGGQVQNSAGDMEWPAVAAAASYTVWGWFLAASATEGASDLLYYSDLRDSGDNVISKTLGEADVFKVSQGNATINEL